MGWAGIWFSPRPRTAVSAGDSVVWVDRRLKNEPGITMLISDAKVLASLISMRLTRPSPEKIFLRLILRLLPLFPCCCRCLTNWRSLFALRCLCGLEGVLPFLSGAVWSGVDLFGVDLLEADLFGADLLSPF
jgi:apolipoprotein N-acyltransferase